MKNIYLIRHCEAEGQNPDADLTEDGKSQAIELANYLEKEKIDYVISSPYLRAFKTIQPLCQSLGLTCEADERLVEKVLSDGNMDDWMDKLKESYVDLDIKYKGGESSREAMDRGVQPIEKLLKRKEENFVVVTHGALLTLILKHYNNTYGYEDWKNMSNPDVFKLTVNNDNQISVLRVWR